MGPLKENPTGYGVFHTLWAVLSHSSEQRHHCHSDLKRMPIFQIGQPRMQFPELWLQASKLLLVQSFEGFRHALLATLWRVSGLADKHLGNSIPISYSDLILDLPQYLYHPVQRVSLICHNPSHVSQVLLLNCCY